MDYRDQRPPRAARPGSTQQHQQPRSPPPDENQYQSAYQSRPPMLATDGSRGNVSFQNIERGDRQGPLDSPRLRTTPNTYQNQASPGLDVEFGEGFDPARVGRKKSLVRPDREKIDPNHRQWHYRSHVAQLEDEGPGRVGVMPSSAYSTSNLLPLPNFLGP